MAREINKILEIDMDTEREDQLFILQLLKVRRKRARQPTGDWDLRDNAIMLINALGATILDMEASGMAPKGEAMREAMEKLQEVYVDASCITKNVVVANGSMFIVNPPTHSDAKVFDGTVDTRRPKYPSWLRFLFARRK